MQNIELGSSEDSEEESILSEINITPLTDVFLVLLIIFMVTSSVMSQLGVDVELPQSKQANQSSQPEAAILTLTASGRVLLNGNQVSIENESVFIETLQGVLKTTSNKSVVIEGDKRALLGRMIEMMDLSKKAGAQSFSIATQNN